MADTSDAAELAGPTGELLGKLIGDAVASGNYGQIQALLAKLKQGYADLPGSERLNPKDVGPSQLGGVTEDPRYAGAENEALRQLMAESQGGMNDSDRAKLEQAKLKGLATAAGMKGGTEDSLRRRGLYSSGAELASDLSSQQGGINAAYQGDLATAAAASDRSLQALAAGGRMATTLGSRDLEQKNSAASANDRIAQFNAGRDDTANMYNSDLAQKDMLQRLKGMGATDAQITALMNAQGKGAGAKGASYGGQVGSLLSALARSGKGNSGGSDPSEWEQWPGSGGDSVSPAQKLGENDDALAGAGDYSSLDELKGLFA